MDHFNGTAANILTALTIVILVAVIHLRLIVSVIAPKSTFGEARQRSLITGLDNKASTSRELALAWTWATAWMLPAHEVPQVTRAGLTATKNDQITPGPPTAPVLVSGGKPSSVPSSRRLGRLCGRSLLVTALVVPLALASGASPASGPVASATVPSAQVAAAARPNIVYVLLDDASLELVDHMVNTSTMRRRGADFRNAFVSQSLCCPSRASILTGRYPHLTGVRGNVTGADRDHPVGGFRAFTVYGNESIAINVTLQGAGYSTGFIGKFMNGYEPTR